MAMFRCARDRLDWRLGPSQKQRLRNEDKQLAWLVPARKAVSVLQELKLYGSWIRLIYNSGLTVRVFH